MSKSKSITEMRDEQTQLETRKTTLISTLEKEERKANEKETTELRSIAVDVANLEYEIAIAEARNKKGSYRTHQTEDDLKQVSFLRSIREVVEGRVSDETRKLDDMGANQMRSCGLSKTGHLCLPTELRGTTVQATITGDGKETIPEDLINIMGPLRDRLVLTQAGASFLTGLTGNIVLPDYTGSTAQWEGEVDTAKNGKGTFGKKTMAPKRIASYIDISKQFLMQESVGAENMLRNDLVNAIAIKLQSTIFGSHVHADTMPDGFFTGVPSFATSGVATYKGILDLESSVEVENALEGNLSYIMHSKGRGILKQTLRASNVAEGFIWDNNMVNGYKAHTTTGMTKGLGEAKDEYGIIFGNWSDLIIGQWGAIDITVDTTTRALDAVVRLVVNAYFDVIPRRKESFALGSFK